MLMTQLPVRAVDLDDGVSPRQEGAGEAGAVGARGLDAKGANATEGAGPGFQVALALRTNWDGHRTQTHAEPVEGYSRMDVFVGIDANDDLGRGGHIHRRLSARGEPGRLVSGQDCDG